MYDKKAFYKKITIYDVGKHVQWHADIRKFLKDIVDLFCGKSNDWRKEQQINVVDEEFPPWFIRRNQSIISHQDAMDIGFPIFLCRSVYEYDAMEIRCHGPSYEICGECNVLTN